MEEEKKVETTQVVEEQTLVNSPNTEGTPKATVKPAEVETAPKTFTQEAVDEIVKSRLKRDREAFYKRYGVGNRDELDSMVGKSQSFDVMKERYANIKTENSSLKEKIAFLNQNINPAKEDDVRAYFKGKGIEFNEQNLISELETHPEWVKENPQPKVVGVDHRGVFKAETEEDKQKRIFGY